MLKIAQNIRACTEVNCFRNAMLEKLNRPENAAKGNWRKEILTNLMNGCDQEVFELIDALRSFQEGTVTAQAVMEECVDVANFAMMIFDKVGGCEIPVPAVDD